MRFRDNLPATGSESFLKLKDKESVYGVFRGDLYEFFSLWEAGKSKVVPEGTAGAGFRFRVNFVTKVGNQYLAKIFENGATVYQDLKALHDEYGLEEIVIKMTRNGVGLETSYSLMPILKTPVGDDVRNLKLLPLEHQAAPAHGSPKAGDHLSQDDLPF